MSATEIIEKELSYQIMAAAYEVHNQLGPGFLEALYEEALVLELQARGHVVERQKRIPVCYKGVQIGEHVLDLLVDRRVIVELKASSEISPVHKQQAISYVKATGFPLAIVINFGTGRVQSARLANTKQSDLNS